MKIGIHSFLLLFFCSFTFTLAAQSLETDPAEPKEVGEECEEIPVPFHLTNISTGDLNFLWRIDRIDVPLQWELQICDAVTCYNWGIESCPENNPNVMASGQEITFTSVKVRPNDVEYVGIFNLVFFNEDDENDVYLSLPIEVTANSCTSSSKNLDGNNEIKIYPNPTTDIINISYSEKMSTIKICNIIGREVMSIDSNSEGYYDVSGLSNGMYLLRLLDKEGEVLDVLRLTKN